MVLNDPFASRWEDRKRGEKGKERESMRKEEDNSREKLLSHRKKKVMASGEILTASKTVFSQQAFC